MTQQRDEFDVARPAGARVKLSEFIGRTVLFSPTEYIPVEKDAQGNIVGGGVKTADFGAKDVVLTDMVVLDGPAGPEQYDDVMVFNGHVVGALKRRVGGMYLAVIEWGAEKVKGNYPLMLGAPTEACIQMARDYRAGRAVAAALPSAPDTAKADPNDPFAVTK